MCIHASDVSTIIQYMPIYDSNEANILVHDLLYIS